VLSTQGWYAPGAVANDSFFKYYVFCGAVSVVELDVLTGEAKILSSDIVYDCGESLSPLVDIGQIEGAFVQGIGYYLTEEVVYDDLGRVSLTATAGAGAPGS
jgi:xanthine dehydrogenase/oxidase